MYLVPKLTVSRFNELQSGELFMFADDERRCLALKGKLADDGDEFALLLGPGLEKQDQLRVIQPQPKTVVAIGNAYLLRLPVDPLCWSTTLPSGDVACMAVAGETAYFRGNVAAPGPHFISTWIEVSTGILRYQPPSETAAYVLKWDIVITTSVLNGESIVPLP